MVAKASKLFQPLAELYLSYNSLPNANTIYDQGFFLGNDSIDIKDKIDLAYDVISGVLNP